VVAGILPALDAGASRPAEKLMQIQPLEFFLSFLQFGRSIRAAGCRPLRQAGHLPLLRLQVVDKVK
jgi:hypothetical protein